MPTDEESVCCKEIERVVDVIESEDGNPPCCITLHPGFAGVCLNPWALNVAYMAYKQQYPQNVVQQQKTVPEWVLQTVEI